MNEAKIRKRNYFALSIEGSLFFSGLAFIDANAVIPVFIFDYTQSLKLTGLATTINLALPIITQILIGPYVKSIQDMPKYITRLMFIFRPLPLLMVPVLFSSMSPNAKVAIFLVIYALFFAGDGLLLVPWNDLFGRTISSENRGKVFGNQLLWGGLGGLVAGFLIKILLESTTISDAARFSIIFSCSAAILIVSAFVMLIVRDFPHTVHALPTNNWHYYAHLPSYLKKNPHLRELSVIRILHCITSMISPLLILFGRAIFHLDIAQVSTLIYIQIVGGLLGGVLWSYVSSKFGNKHVIVLTQLIGLIIPMISLACFLLMDHKILWIILWPLVLANGINMGSWIGFLNYAIDISDEDNRTINLLISNVITFPLTVLAFFAGLVADKVGFTPLFLISSLTACCGLFLSLRLKSFNDLTSQSIES